MFYPGVGSPILDPAVPPDIISSALHPASVFSTGVLISTLWRTPGFRFSHCEEAGWTTIPPFQCDLDVRTDDATPTPGRRMKSLLRHEAFGESRQDSYWSETVFGEEGDWVCVCGGGPYGQGSSRGEGSHLGRGLYGPILPPEQRRARGGGRSRGRDEASKLAAVKHKNMEPDS